jgi:phosphatidylserine/phosphatidylglycerophosphate/cardiolipin synthase-like enzyme
VIAALNAAIAGGVHVDLVLETAEDSAGKLTYDQLRDFLRLEGVAIWHWPSSARPVPGTSLHAKAIVADCAVALVTSANLTGHALIQNIELGLLIRDESVAGRIDEHVRGLMRRDVLRRLTASRARTAEGSPTSDATPACSTPAPPRAPR